MVTYCVAPTPRPAVRHSNAVHLAHEVGEVGTRSVPGEGLSCHAAHAAAVCFGVPPRVSDRRTRFVAIVASICGPTGKPAICVHLIAAVAARGRCDAPGEGAARPKQPLPGTLRMPASPTSWARCTSRKRCSRRVSSVQAALKIRHRIYETQYLGRTAPSGAPRTASGYQSAAVPNAGSAPPSADRAHHT